MPSADRPAASRDTIAAVATPPGRGGIGVIRVSGPDAGLVARTLVGKLPQARRATYASARDASGAEIDHGIALFFPGPHSYTGEDVFEFHGHGGNAVMAGLLQACLAAGARLAGAGEFTQRAFLNEKLDLAQAEAVSDLIEAASAEAVRSALRSLSGDFSAEIDAMVHQLIELRALIEAMLDFPEEEVDALHVDQARERLDRVRRSHERVLERSRRGSLLREGIQIALVGRPNVGKSSLLNRLAGEERAIVTPIPGTTRDALREEIRIEGVPVHIVDTAGLRDSMDELERIGMERTWHEVSRAGLVLVVLDASAGLVPEDEGILRRLPAGIPVLPVLNKSDLPAASAALPGTLPSPVRISAKTGAGMEALRIAIVAAAGWETGGEPTFLARERHLRALRSAGEHLDAAARLVERWELLAEELRLAQEALASITGQFNADDLLGEIFSRFCIGK